MDTKAYVKSKLLQCVVLLVIADKMWGVYMLIFFYNQKQKFARGDMERRHWFHSQLKSVWLHSCRHQGLSRTLQCPLSSISEMVLLGNFNIIGIIVTDPRLNTPMYFFLGNLSIIDLPYSTVTVPKAMANILSWKKVSSVCCVAQLFLYASFHGNRSLCTSRGMNFLAQG